MNVLKVMRGLALAAGLLAATGACGTAEQPLRTEELEAIAASVDSATRAFERAQRERDPERVVGHLAPDFNMLVDGVREGRATKVGRIREGFATVSYIEPGFTDLRPVVVARNAALVSFASRDSVVTTDGSVSVTGGVTTLVWQRYGDDWLIRFAHAQHESPEDSER